MKATYDILENVLNSSNDMVILVDKGFNVIYVNTSMQNSLFDYYGRYLNKGDDYRSILLDEYKAEFIQGFQKVIEGGSFSTEIERKYNNALRWYAYQLNPVYNKDGSFYCVKIQATDITERKLAELDVIASNMKLSSVLDTTSDSIVFLSKDFSVLMLNVVAKNRIRHILGKDIQVGDDFRQFIYPGGEEVFVSNFNRALGGEKLTYEYNFKINHESTWIKSIYAPVYNNDGSFFGVSVFTSDIGEQKKAELALKDSEEKFRKIVESAANPIIIIDEGMNIQMINSEVENVFGYSKSELIGASISMLIPDRFRERHGQYQQDYIKHSQPIRMGINRHTPARKKNGEEITIEASLNTFEINQERFVLLIIQDVTHRILSEQKLIKTNQELTLLNKINDLTLVIQDKERLLNEVCRELVLTSKYKLAWVCRKEDIDEPEGVVKPVAAYGETDYIKELKISLTDSLHSRGPTATVLRFERPVVTNNVLNSDDFRPWSDLAQKYGIAASLVLPLRFDSSTIGCINIYSERVDAFDRDEMEMLERMARNISLTMSNITINAEKENANYQLNKRIRELKTIYQVNALLQNEELDLEELFHKIVMVLPKGFQYTDICGAKIQFNHLYWQTPNYKSSKYKLKSSFESIDNHLCHIEVVYLDDAIQAKDAVFLREEYDLIYAVKEMVKVYYNKSTVARQLSNSEQNLHSVFENTNVGHMLMDSDFHIRAFNKVFFERYYRLTNVKISEGDNFKDTLQTSKVNQVNRAIEKSKRSKKSITYETVYMDSGEKRYFNININPILTENEDVSGYSMSAVDITDLKKIETERQQVINNLVLRNRDLEQFAYIVSHNLRAPLVNILGIASLFDEGSLSQDDLRISIANIKKSAIHLDTVVHDLNDILNIRNTGKEKWQMVELNGLMEEVKNSIMDSFVDISITINTNFKMVNTLNAVKAYLHSIFYNLISNSVKYARENVAPRVDIWTEKKSNTIEIHYSDNGSGIDVARYKDQLFGLYKRFDTKKSGKGMGMFLVKNEVEVMGGSIEMQSELGVGTRFKMVFPIKD